MTDLKEATVHAYFIAAVRLEIPDGFDIAGWENPFIPGEVFLSLEHYDNTTMRFPDGPLTIYVSLLKLGTGLRAADGSIGFSAEMGYLLNAIKIGFDADTIINQTLHQIVNKAKEIALAPETEEAVESPMATRGNDVMTPAGLAEEPAEPTPEELADAAAAAAVIVVRGEIANALDAMRDELIGPRGVVVDIA